MIRRMIVFLVFFLLICDLTADTSPKPIRITSLPDHILLIIGEHDQYYLPRVKAIHELPTNMTLDQINACYEFLQRKIETQNLRDLEFNGLKNELVWALIRQERKLEELAGHLVTMYYDKTYDETWRDYCVQFFGKWYPDAPDNEDRQEMINGLWHALKTERTNRIAGTAGSMLCFLAETYPEVEKEKVAEAAFEAISDPECANISKVALLQVGATLKDPRFLPIARQLVDQGTDSVLLASALSTVGALGDHSDLERLKPAAASTDIRKAGPARAAIGKIRKR